MIVPVELKELEKIEMARLMNNKGGYYLTEFKKGDIYGFK